jgi:hypothetical protein
MVRLGARAGGYLPPRRHPNARPCPSARRSKTRWRLTDDPAALTNNAASPPPIPSEPRVAQRRHDGGTPAGSIFRGQGKCGRAGDRASATRRRPARDRADAPEERSSLPGSEIPEQIPHSYLRAPSARLCKRRAAAGMDDEQQRTDVIRWRLLSRVDAARGAGRRTTTLRRPRAPRSYVAALRARFSALRVAHYRKPSSTTNASPAERAGRGSPTAGSVVGSHSRSNAA